MRLSKPMLKVFQDLVLGKKTLQEIARQEKKSLNYVSEVVQDLEKEGFVKKTSNFSLKKSRFIIEISDTSHASKLKELIFKYPTIKFEEILSDGRLLFLTTISEDWIDTKNIVQLTKLSKYSLDRYIPQMKNRGILLYKDGLFKLNSIAWSLLKEFLISYKSRSSPEGIIKWKYQEETLLESNKRGLVGASLTGFACYGMKITLVSHLFVLPEKTLSNEEIFVHSLFEIQDPRTLNLALVFFLKNKLSKKKVSSLAMKYGKYSMFKEISNILDSKEEKIHSNILPTFERKDFLRIAKMYGVKNV
jgi:predicted transcriptional regulator